MSDKIKRKRLHDLNSRGTAYILFRVCSFACLGLQIDNRQRKRGDVKSIQTNKKYFRVSMSKPTTPKTKLNNNLEIVLRTLRRKKA